jgi:hypothetical protein
MVLVTMFGALNRLLLVQEQAKGVGKSKSIAERAIFFDAKALEFRVSFNIEDTSTSNVTILVAFH